MPNTPKAKPVVLTGVKPTGRLHIGHYIGAVNNWRKMMEETEALFFIPDLHCLTLTPKPEEVAFLTREVVLWYIACGLDPAKCKIFLQSHVIGHTEVAWILGCLTPVGQMERMTQYKDYLAKGIPAQGGILYYPILMASDILLYDADIVPVGEDQKQHVELTRDLAQKFNRVYGETFKVPDVVIPKLGARIMALNEPTQKMSKSDNNLQGSILLEDTPDKIRKKIMSAVTDSGSEIVAREDKPGITNLLTIQATLTGRTIAEVEADYAGKRYGDFKKGVTEVVVETLRPIQARHDELAKDPEYLRKVFADGAAYAQPRALATMEKVYRAVGLLPK
jgi:tryptophanyl-tRNA synthetase